MKTNRTVFALLVVITTGINAQQTSKCINADFELADFSNWMGSTGSCCPVNTTVPGIVTGRHTIMSGTGVDPNSLGYIPYVPPGGGVYTAQLGNDAVGAEAEQLSYTFTVDPGNALFIYRYAVVLEDPGHSAQEQPRFSIRVYDQSNIPVTCGEYDVVASANIPGFINNGNLRIKPWTTVGIELSAYVGQTITIEFTTADCGLGGHFGYAYLECRCYPFQLSSIFCKSDATTTLYAPEGFADYLWSNGDTTTSITVNSPSSGMIYTCTMTSVSGCQVTLSTTLIPELLAPEFLVSDSCMGRPVQFTDASYVIYGSPINQWWWNFGDGDTSTLRSPGHIYSSAGTFAVQLITQNTFGCRDSLTKYLTVHASPGPAFTTNVIEGCEPLAVHFTDSTSSTDGAITGWQWDFGNNLFSVAQNPSVVYQDGTYSVTLISTTVFGCSDTITYNRLVNAYPSAVADFHFTPGKASDFIPSVIFIDRSEKTESWLYDFGDGSTSTVSNPVHTYHNPGIYNLSQIVITQFGCSDTMRKMLEYVSEQAFYFPNTFSPNGDGKNDVFKGDGFGVKDFKLSVYNRYGQMLYATGSENEGWDGTYKNSPVSEGTYLFAASIKDDKNKFHEWRGKVTLIR